VGKILGGQSFERMGHLRDFYSVHGPASATDLGRFNVTQPQDDRYKLKVPTLRNIAQTYPYLHTGATTNLVEVVALMSKFQTRRPATAPEIVPIVKFLETLTGEDQGKLLP
jgi:cytochrome c peroxidase